MPFNPEIKDAHLVNQQPRNYFRLSPKLARVAAIGLVITTFLETQLGDTPEQSLTLSPSIAAGYDPPATKHADRLHKTEKPEEKQCTSMTAATKRYTNWICL